jgi:hypothetical protein
MAGIAIGQPWAEGGFKNLRIEGYAADAAHLAALTRVVNATQGTAWPVDQVAQ